MIKLKPEYIFSNTMIFYSKYTKIDFNFDNWIFDNSGISLRLYKNQYARIFNTDAEYCYIDYNGVMVTILNNNVFDSHRLWLQYCLNLSRKQKIISIL